MLKYDPAGDPMTGLRWSRRTTENIAAALTALNIRVSANTVTRLLHEMRYSIRVNHKTLGSRSDPDRNRGFDYIADLRDRFRRSRCPIISVDTKKGELVGLFRNPGARWSSQPRRVRDHDFRSDALGFAIPHGIYDPVDNRGAVIVGVSHNTAAFAANAIAHWWSREGCHRYTGSGKLLILADTGGSNGCRTRAWKSKLQSQLANGHRLPVTVAHYPTGASKWNPIEHRLFSEISRNWAGEPLDSYANILNLIRTTSTQTGLAVSAYLDRRHYPLGDKPSPEQFRRLRLEPDDTLPRWNYTIKPNLGSYS